MISPELKAMIKTWSEIIQPIVAKCEVAAAFEKEVFWNAEGAKALGKLIKEMARLLDDEARATIIVQSAETIAAQHEAIFTYMRAADEKDAAIKRLEHEKHYAQKECELCVDNLNAHIAAQAEEIKALREALDRLNANLATRDDFLVMNDLWSSFVASLPAAPAQPWERK